MPTALLPKSKVADESHSRPPRSGGYRGPIELPSEINHSVQGELPLSLHSCSVLTFTTLLNAVCKYTFQTIRTIYGFLALGVVLGVRGEFELELDWCVARIRADDRVGIAPAFTVATLFLFALGVITPGGVS